MNNDELSILNEIKISIQNVLYNSPETLIREDVLGLQLSFTNGKESFDKVYSLVKRLDSCNLANVPFQYLQAINQGMNEFRNIINSIASFQPTDSNPISLRDSLINQLNSCYANYYLTFMQCIVFSNSDSNRLEEMEREFKVSIQNNSEFAEKSLNDLNIKLKEIENLEMSIRTILENVKSASAEIGVTQHAVFFDKESKYHSKMSLAWLASTLVIGILTIIWGYMSFQTKTIGSTVGDSISELGSKVIVLSVLYYILVWSAKNYNASRHNFIVNKHRQNALSTFETFVNAAEDFETKNAVLIQATQSIFSNQPSGYINKDNEQETPNKVIEIMRSIGPISKVN